MLRILFPLHALLTISWLHRTISQPHRETPLLTFLDDLTKDLLALLSLSPFYGDPYMKVVQAYDATKNELPIPLLQALIAPPTILPPSLVLSLSPMFDSQDFLPPEENSSKDTETSESPTLVSPSSLIGSSSPVRLTAPPPDYPFDKSIFAKLDNSLWIIPRPLRGELDLKKPKESDAYDHLWK
nr:hypothetical protein [Tanacetum cinerariifolium]